MSPELYVRQRGQNKVDLHIRLIGKETSDAMLGTPAGALNRAKDEFIKGGANKFSLAARYATGFLNGISDDERKRLSRSLEYALRHRIDQAGIIFTMVISASGEKVYSVTKTNLVKP